MTRTLHLLTAGHFDRISHGAYPTRAAAEAEIVRLVLNGEGDSVAQGAEIVEVHLDDAPDRAARALADLWRGVTFDVRAAVAKQCGGLVPLLDALRDALPVVELSDEQLDALRARLTS